MSGVSRSRWRFTPEEFALRAAQHRRLQPRTRQIAESVRVHGVTVSNAAILHGCSRQFVSASVRRIAGADDTPQDWVTRVVTLPPEQMREVLLMVRRARSAHRKSNPDYAPTP